MDKQVADPVLAAFHEPKTEPECIYFEAYCTETGDLRMERVVRPVDDVPAPLKVEIVIHKDEECHAA